MIRTRLFAFALVFALVAGPVAAACGDCCPEDEGALAIAAAADCCGDCSETLDRSPERPSAALRAASPGGSSVAVAVYLAQAPHVTPMFVDALPGLPTPAFSPPTAFAPLRL